MSVKMHDGAKRSACGMDIAVWQDCDRGCYDIWHGLANPIY